MTTFMETSLKHEENQYLSLIHQTLNTGTREESRNGTTLSIFGNMMRFSLKNGTLPLLTTKQLAWKTCFRELMWFINGQTDNRLLKKQGVHIWDDNGSRDFLDKNGLSHYPEDILGPIYGWQWRHFNAPYDLNQPHNNTAEGIDQLMAIIGALKDEKQRTSRRLIMTAWNPCQLNQMALPPCHILCQFNVREGKYLSCALYQRSGDVGLGVPFNIASYSFLTHILASHCGLEADEFVYFLGNAHIYESHIDVLKEQIRVSPYPFPKIEIKPKPNIEDYCCEDIIWKTPYQHHPPLKMKMFA